jgi:hypothetical protein
MFVNMNEYLEENDYAFEENKRHVRLISLILRATLRIAL